jgi:hypothetical protein
MTTEMTARRQRPIPFTVLLLTGVEPVLGPEPFFEHPFKIGGKILHPSDHCQAGEVDRGRTVSNGIQAGLLAVFVDGADRQGYASF